MNKLFCASLALASLAFLPAAHARPAHGHDAGLFVRGQAGQGYFNGASNLHSTTYSVDLGYRWALGSRNNLGVEIGYIKPETLDYDNGYGISSAQTHAYTLGATYQLTFGGYGSGPHWFFAARAGYMHWTQDETGTEFLYYDYPAFHSVHYTSSADGTGSYAGLGVGFDFNDHVGLGLYYDYYLAEFQQDQYGNYSVDGLSVPSLGLEVRF